uniref:Uncharacterized protein n=1 Tax=Anguilla anguilla TaxID=7936 RepID=A0A0E9WZR7_ANGAN
MTESRSRPIISLRGSFPPHQFSATDTKLLPEPGKGDETIQGFTAQVLMQTFHHQGAL